MFGKKKTARIIPCSLRCSVNMRLRFYVVGEFEDVCCSVEKSEIQAVIPHNAGDTEFVCGASAFTIQF